MEVLSWLTTRQWKQRAEEAIAHVHHGAERERLQAHLCARVFEELNGRSVRAGVRDDRAVQVASAVERLLDRRTVETSLGLRYLESMQDRLRYADYEDIPRLRAETRWLEGYLLGRLHPLDATSRAYRGVDRVLPAVNRWQQELADEIARQIARESQQLRRA